MRTLAVVFAMSGLVLADDGFRQKVQIVKTEHVDFPTRGAVRLKNSTGALTMEGWDQPGVEITTVKSTRTAYASAERAGASHELDRVQVTVGSGGDELVITTDFLRHRGFPPSSPVGRATNFDLDYRIKVPREARLVVNHDIGDVHFDRVTSDIQATTLQGAITLHPAEGGQYAIDADFPGSTKHRFCLVGHQCIQSSPALHRLYLRDGFGDNQHSHDPEAADSPSPESTSRMTYCYGKNLIR
jgi:hypothetical protein